jgi:hypothetical protein
MILDVLRHDQAGSGPAAGHFFLLRQKVSNQEKGDREAAALRVPKSRSQSGGGPQTRYAQTCVPLIPCLTPTFGSCLNAEQVNVNSHVNINVKSHVNTNTNTNTNTNIKGPASVRFFYGRKPPSLATRVSVFFRGFIAKITLTLLADSERLPSHFRVEVDGVAVHVQHKQPTTYTKPASCQSAHSTSY